jgi:O-methyltransferase involved in polyketide biosynthesis
VTQGIDPEFAPRGINLDHPNAARIYDWFLGGSANWAIDREFGERATQALPLVRTLARVNRDFLGRAVRYCARQGVTQFLDLGSGVPTVGNVHEVADSIDPDSRCVYVDNEPVAVAHSEILLERHGDPDRHAVLSADLRDVDSVWQRAAETGVLDPEKPVALLMVAVLHFVPEGADEAVAEYRELLPSGSFMTISHVSDDGVPAEMQEQLDRLGQQYVRSGTNGRARSRAEFASLFGDFELVDPGVGWVSEWRLDEAESEAAAQFAGNPAACCVLGGVGRKP